MIRYKSFLKTLTKPFTSKSSKDSNEVDLEKIAAQEQKHFPFEILVAATNNFHPSLKLGEGGFGPVFKGKLGDGREIAVKKLSRSSTQGKKEFLSESKLLARVQHRNVVNLLGYCVHAAERLLVYQYVVNESLDKILFKGDKGDEFDWKRRYDVITGIAKGLVYLHEEAHCRIIHRDIKASNILLDHKWVPKISDFGMARLYPEDQTHINTRVAGTNGYMAPEYLVHGHLSEKADVFSFGVVLLEIISGQKNSRFNRDPQCRSLLEWVYKLYKKQRSFEVIDPRIVSSADPHQVAMCIQIGLLCVQSDPKTRPDMSRVVMILSKKPTILEEPARPGHPGTRYTLPRRPTAAASSSASASATISQSFGSTDTSTASASASASASATATSSGTVRSPRSDPHGKRPITN
ncbi:cysteine-rich receptor-like protein kinase 43 [Salvia miltiorrhiza]|uniref:cysteine-rich receptor-like protein kinase 43 n=1 Tax=Salvia miltiorrhiza TaxID=226208 RepID=UPI0025AD7333|nr:cysteine-rich receptor-like protein kinase 43 [Salvia miltiorrhiza]